MEAGCLPAIMLFIVMIVEVSQWINQTIERSEEKSKRKKYWAYRKQLQDYYINLDLKNNPIDSTWPDYKKLQVRAQKLYQASQTAEKYIEKTYPYLVSRI